MVYDRVSFTWVTPDEMARRNDWREELMFQRQLSQGQLAAPMVISDSLGVHGLESQLDGKYYDSKSNLRRTYREAGMTEVGNDVPDGHTFRQPNAKLLSQSEKDARHKSVRESVRGAISKHNLTKKRSDEIR